MDGQDKLKEIAENIAMKKPRKIQKVNRLAKDENINTVQKEKNKKIFMGIASIFIFNYMNIFLYYCWLAENMMNQTGLGVIVQALNDSFKFGSTIIKPVYLSQFLLDVYPSTWFIGGILLGIVGASVVWFINFYKSINKRTYRFGEEFGSAKKGDIAKDAIPLKAINNPKPERRNEDNEIILSKNIQVDMDTRHTFLGNDNIFVIGGTGSGKTRFFVKPNILQLSCNYVVIDPKGSVIRECGNAFKEAGYEIRVLNLVDFDKSMCYNPFEYFNSPEDVTTFVQNLIENTTEKGSSGDQFWTKSETMWMTACIDYIMATCKGTDMCNMNTLMLMLDHSEAREDDEKFKSDVDMMFEILEEELAELNEGRSEYTYAHLAVKNYNNYKMAAGKTAKSILISVAVRLQHFNLPAIRRIFAKDELHLDHLGNPMVKNKTHPNDLNYDIERSTYEKIRGEEYEHIEKDRLRKTILFVIISDGDTTFSYMASIILQQLYKQLYLIADKRHDSRLPIHTRIINDEFATCGKQKEMLTKIATMRSREISTTIIVQSIAQIKQDELYGQVGWEILMDCCSLTLFLGGVKGETTINRIKDLAGKETVAYKTQSVTKGNNPSYTEGEQYTSADRYDYSKLTNLPNNRCLVHISGYDMFEDTKYDVMDHKNVDLTTDGKKGDAVAMDVMKMKEEMAQIDIGRKRAFVDELKNKKINMEDIEGFKAGEISETKLADTVDEYFIDNELLSRIENEIEESSKSSMMAEYDSLPN